MNQFEILLNNDPDFQKNRKEHVEKIATEKDNYRKQKEITKTGPPEPRLTMGKFIPNTKEALKKLRKAHKERLEALDEKAKEYKHKRAKELSSNDPKGYQRWYRKETKKENTQQITKDTRQHDHDYDRDW